MLLHAPRTEGWARGLLREVGDVQAGLSPHEGPGTEPWREEGQGWGCWMRHAEEPRIPN